MARMGFRTFQEMIGRSDMLRMRPDPINDKAKLLDFRPILRNALDFRPRVNIVGGSVPQDFELEKRLVSRKTVIDR